MDEHTDSQNRELLENPVPDKQQPGKAGFLPGGGNGDGAYLALAQTLDAMIMVSNQDHEITFMNRALAERLGGDRTGELCHKVLNGMDAKCPWCESHRVWGANTASWEYRCPRDNHWYQELCAPITLEDGVVSKFTLLRDISGRKEAEESARVQRDLALALCATRDMERALELCLGAAIRVSAMDCGCLYLLEEGAGGLNLEHAQGLGESFLADARSFGADSPLARLAMNGLPVYTRYAESGLPMTSSGRSEDLQALAMIPIHNEGSVIGCLTVASHELREVPRSGRDTLESIAGRMGSAILRIRAETRLREHVALERLVPELAARFISAEPDEVDNEIKHALRRVGELSGVDRCYLTVVDSVSMTVTGVYEWVAPDIPAHPNILTGKSHEEYPWAASILLSQRPLHIPRVRDLPPEAAREKELFKKQDIVSLLNVPLIWDQPSMGFFGFDMVRRERTWTDDGIALLEILGHVFGSALDRRRTETELRHHREFERLVEGISTRFISLELDEIHAEIQRSVEVIGDFAEVDRCYVGVLAEDVGSFSEVYEWRAPGVEPVSGRLAELKPERIPSAYDLLRQGKIVRAPSLDALPPAASGFREFLEEGQVRSCVVVPLIVGKTMVGLFAIDSVRSERSLPSETISLLEIVGQVFSSAIERRHAELRRRALEEQFQQAQKLESLGLLAGGIAHDFNNLLMGILGKAGLATLSLPDGSPVAQHIADIETAALRAADLTNQLLAYSGKGHFVVGPLDLTKLVEEMSHLLEAAISKRISIRYNCAEDLPAIQGDATQMRQIIMNLITNAADAIGDEDGAILITTGAREVDSGYLAGTYIDEDLAGGLYAFVEVSDTGCGMDEETRAKIFDPFFTTKFTGRGLGLAAVLGIVRGHRGAVKVYSEIGEGTTIKVLFPTTGRLATSQIGANEEKTPSSWRGKGTILVVDDEKDVRLVAEETLGMFGFDVLTACDGLDGVQVFSKHADDISLVLLDMTMPRMGGHEAFDALREIRPDIPVVLSSGYNEVDTASRFGGEGPSGFIQKPYLPQALIDCIRGVLEGEDAPG